MHHNMLRLQLEGLAPDKAVPRGSRSEVQKGCDRPHPSVPRATASQRSGSKVAQHAQRNATGISKA